MIRRLNGLAGRILSVSLLASCARLLNPADAFAQSVRGRVVDPEARPVPLAEVIVLRGTGVVTTVKTTADGRFGPIAIAPGANLNPERKHPSMFEPVHGSAPDIYGKKIANPIGQIWSGAMMLDHFGEAKAAASVVSAIEDVVGGGGPRTPDMGGQASTSDLGEAVAAQVR